MNLSTAVTARLTKELVPGESVVWSMQLGNREFVRARRGCLLAATAILLVPCLPLLLFVNNKAWCLVGTLLLIGALFILSAIRQYRKNYFQSAYVITNKRAILLAGPQLADSRQLEPQVWSFYPVALRKRETVVRKDGTGDIVLWKRWFHTGDEVDDSAAIAFENLPDVERVDGFLNTLAQQDTEQHKSVSDEELCRSLGWDASLVRADRPKEANKRSAITAASLTGVAFLIVGIYACGCGLHLWTFGSYSSRSDRMYLMMLGVASTIGAVATFVASWQWRNELERRSKINAQQSSAGDVATRAAPEE